MVELELCTLCVFCARARGKTTPVTLMCLRFRARARWWQARAFGVAACSVVACSVVACSVVAFSVIACSVIAFPRARRMIKNDPCKLAFNISDARVV